MDGDPVPVDQAVERVIGDLAFDGQDRRTFQPHLAMHLPEGVDRRRPAMGEIVMATVLALRPIAEIVGADHGERPAETDQDTHINQ